MDTLSKAEWGKSCKHYDNFPLLVKFIDASTPLSVQVHPSDEYAKEKGLIAGKTEAWYILDADEGAGIYLGFNKTVTPEEVEKSALDGTITDLLNFIEVKKGECYFVRSGTVHAIGAGVTVAEVQQSSDVTFRVYDYDRVGADGKKRELHLKSALEVLCYERYQKEEPKEQSGSLETDKRVKTLALNEYFTIYECEGAGKYSSQESFLCVICVDGEGKLNGEAMKKGDTFFSPANEQIMIEGSARYLITGVGI
jgi:mannose-6-phosphate isomerase